MSLDLLNPTNKTEKNNIGDKNLRNSTSAQNEEITSRVPSLTDNTNLSRSTSLNPSITNNNNTTIAGTLPSITSNDVGIVSRSIDTNLMIANSNTNTPEIGGTRISNGGNKNRNSLFSIANMNNNVRHSIYSQDAYIPYLSPNNDSARTVSTSILEDKYHTDAMGYLIRDSNSIRENSPELYPGFALNKLNQELYTSNARQLSHTSEEQNMVKPYNFHKVIEPAIIEAAQILHNERNIVPNTFDKEVALAKRIHQMGVRQRPHETYQNSHFLKLEVNTELSTSGFDSHEEIVDTIATTHTHNLSLPKGIIAAQQCYGESLDILDQNPLNSGRRVLYQQNNDVEPKYSEYSVDNFDEKDSAEILHPENASDMENNIPIQYIDHKSVRSYNSQEYTFGEIFSIWRVSLVIVVCTIVPPLFFVIYYADRSGLSEPRILSLILNKQHRTALLKGFTWEVDITWFRNICFWLGTIDVLIILAFIGIGFGVGLTR